jgi:putative two-component system response regulator
MVTEQKIFNSRILIIDDEPANIRLLKKTLEQEGFCDIQSVQDSRKALDAYKEYNPHLVLLDLRMPNLDGFRIMEQLHQTSQNSYIPIMVLTAEDESHIRLRALNSGAIDFLSKPFDYSEVIIRIKNILKVRLLTIEQQTRPKGEPEKIAREISRKTHNVDIDIIQSLCRANRVRFKQEGDNLIRVSHYALLLGKEIGLKEKHCKDLRYASSTYDIGKIGIPQSILKKENNLNSEELELFKTHTTLGAELLSGSDTELMKMARRIALEHHENWDGRGYPNGLKGEAICLEARIVSICDVFEGMTSNGPNNPKQSVEETVSYIEKNSGRYFDPKLVSGFKKVVPSILGIQKEYPDQEGICSFESEENYKFDSGIIPKLKSALPTILASQKEKNVLVVDDLTTMRAAYKMVCRQVGFSYENIHEASGGQMALKLLNKKPVDLLVTDLYMPNMSGLDLIREVRALPNFKTLPIIVVSEENRKEIILNVLQKGANQYLLKPFNSYQLEEKINQILFALNKI